MFDHVKDSLIFDTFILQVYYSFNFQDISYTFQVYCNSPNILISLGTQI